MRELSTMPTSASTRLQASFKTLSCRHGFSQSEIGTVLGVQADQVKAYICQARSNLISDRTARETDCGEIREELAKARGVRTVRTAKAPYGCLPLL